MNKVLVGLGLLVLLVGGYLAALTAAGVWFKFPPTTFYTESISFLLLQQAIVALMVLIIGFLSVAIGLKDKI